MFHLPKKKKNLLGLFRKKYNVNVRVLPFTAKVVVLRQPSSVGISEEWGCEHDKMYPVNTIFLILGRITGVRVLHKFVTKTTTDSTWAKETIVEKVRKETSHKRSVQKEGKTFVDPKMDTVSTTWRDKDYDGKSVKGV